MNTNIQNHSNLVQAVIEGDDIKCVDLTNKALQKGVSPQEIVKDGLQTGMRIVGNKFSTGDYFVPEMMLAARAVSRAMEVLKPHISDSKTTTVGTIVIGTVFGDIHDIGKNLVAMFLKGAGFEVFDLGIDVSADKFVASVRGYRPDIIGMSALLTTTMPYMSTIMDALRSEGVRSLVKVIIGGAPVTQRFANQIGADGYAVDGGAAIDLCLGLMGK